MNRILLPVALSLLLSCTATAQLQSNREKGNPETLNEFAAEYVVPEGFKVASQRWTPLQVPKGADARPYNGGSLLVVMGRPGHVVRVLWTILYVNWEAKQFQQQDRVYVIEFEGTLEPVEPDPNEPSPGPRKAVRATYIYERLDSIVPRGIQSALVKLNARGIVATAIDQHVRTGEGQIPEQYKEALAAAKEFGLPALVVRYSTGSLDVSRPETEEDVLRAAR